MKDPDDTTASHAKLAMPVMPTSVTATLVIVAGRATVGKVFRIERETMVIGRSSDADIWLDDDAVSRHHAKIVREGNEIRLVDLGSRNGTYCNGERVESHALHDGDKIQVGSTNILKFSYQDVLDEAMQKNLYESATKDGLTGVHNKKFFTEALRKEFAFSVRHNLPLSLMILDVDRFKKINDVHGHPAGDYVLAQVARTVIETIRTEDLFARYGGDEFVLLLRDCEVDSALIAAGRIRDRIERLPLTFNRRALHVTISIGVATLAKNMYPDVDSFLQAADRCLYHAKDGGRNRVEYDDTQPTR